MPVFNPLIKGESGSSLCSHEIFCFLEYDLISVEAFAAVAEVSGDFLFFFGCHCRVYSGGLLAGGLSLYITHIGITGLSTVICQQQPKVKHLKLKNFKCN